MPCDPSRAIGRIDGATGAAAENAEPVFGAMRQEVLACPTLMGGKDGSPAPTAR